jgi:hypothetical protein
MNIEGPDRPFRWYTLIINILLEGVLFANSMKANAETCQSVHMVCLRRYWKLRLYSMKLDTHNTLREKLLTDLNVKLILSSLLGPRFYSAFNRNGCQKQKYEYFWIIERDRCVKLTMLPPSMNRLFRQKRNLNISKPYRFPRRVTRAAFSFYF